MVKFLNKNRKINDFMGLLLCWLVLSCGPDKTPSPGTTITDPKLSPNEDLQANTNNEFCPPADPGFVGGCLDVEDSQSPSPQIKLFYEKKFPTGQEIAESRPILFIGGGPGTSFQSYLDISLFEKISSLGYTLYFYDQRGSGRSSSWLFNKEKFPEEFLGHFHTQQNIEDIERLRANVIQQDKIIIMGHSYGAHLAFGYAAQFPNNVSKLITLNGATDNLGLVLQPYMRNKVISESLKDINSEKIEYINALGHADKLRDYNGNIISDNYFNMMISSLLSTFSGQKAGLKNLFLYLIEINIPDTLSSDSIRKVAIPSRISFQSFVAFPRVFPLFLSLGEAENSSKFTFNKVLNNHIICHDFISGIPKETRTLNFSLLHKYEATKFFNESCKDHFIESQRQVFDIKDSLKDIIVPTLIISGSHDPLVPAVVQKRDFELLFRHNKNTVLLTMKDAGHQTFFEQPHCFNNAILQFLGNRLPNQPQISCEDIP